MSANIFGDYFRLVNFGESHGPAVGAVIEGCPAGVHFQQDLLDENLRRRRPGQSAVVTDRNEQDQPEVLSGVFENRTLGTPIAVIIRNEDQRSKDYDFVKQSPRQGHADDVWKMKFGHVDHRGGGRASGRETVARVIGGSVAKMFLQQLNPELEVVSFTDKIFDLQMSDAAVNDFLTNNTNDQAIYESRVRCPDPSVSNKMEDLLLEGKELGRSYGGRAMAVIRNLPAGWGEPVFKKLKSELARAYMTIGAVSGVEFGNGFSASESEGTEFHNDNKQSVYGGIRGGLSTGEIIRYGVTFKPTSSVMDVAKKGRHDPCIVPRACAVIEAMTYLVLADFALAARLNRV